MTTETLLSVHLNFGGLEARNVVAHLLAADPAAPAEGQCWYNTTDHVLRYRGDGVTVDITPSSGLDTEAVQDIVGAMVAGNTETRITVTYDDAAGKLNFAVDDLVGDHVALADPHAQYQKESEKGAANGYAPLGGDSKVPVAYLPDAVLGAVDFQGGWNANTNTPNIGAAPAKGQYWIVTTAGATALSGINDWQIGDWAVYSGAAWEKVDNTDLVASVFGRTGVIVAADGDYTASQITNVPHGNVASNTVQGAVNEIADEYPAADAAHVAAGDPHAQYLRSVVFDCDAAVSADYVHNLGNADPTVQVRRAADPRDYTTCGVEAKDANTVTVYFAVAPGAGDWHIIVQG